MIFAALSEAADRGELLLVYGGMCRFHVRRDRVVVIREILVLPDCRRNGIASQMVREIEREYPGLPLRARCPREYEAGNAFWKALGFSLVDSRSEVWLWERYP